MHSSTSLFRSVCARPALRAAAMVAAAGFVMPALLLAAMPASAADPGRGRALYQSRCDGCHTTGVHVRAARKASDFAAIRQQVERWNAQLGGAWRREEIDDVAVYLNEQFYKYRCPEALCRAGSAGRAGPVLAGDAGGLPGAGSPRSRELRGE